MPILFPFYELTSFHKELFHDANMKCAAVSFGDLCNRMFELQAFSISTTSATQYIRQGFN